ncbi:hypothetical protein [Hyunsoonleella pacifica]|uniref:hypothetical protein n=1 Tax=Hyunsoonleella pacifica TaxID=1080224 RepID=UPI0013EEEFE7|nr:hypothetical protein [Hyunsoonleella pacifica]GGD10538.1 hypothetical protein GCM10011368_10670 [Hyunsoonleella pacifica]
MILLFLLFAPIFILLFLIFRNIEKQSTLLRQFDATKKSFENIDVSDYKLGDGHIYK